MNERTAEGFLLALPPYIKVIVPDDIFTALYAVAEEKNFEVTALATTGKEYETVEGLKKSVPENMLLVQINSSRRDLSQFWEQVRERNWEQVRERNKVLSNGNRVILLSQ